MMGIQDYDCPQESVLIDTHEGYVLSDRKKTRKRKIAQFINLLLIGLGRPLADIFCKVIPHPGPIPNCLAVDHWSATDKQEIVQLVFNMKVDGVGPIDNRPSTD